MKRRGRRRMDRRVDGTRREREERREKERRKEDHINI